MIYYKGNIKFENFYDIIHKSKDFVVFDVRTQQECQETGIINIEPLYNIPFFVQNTHLQYQEFLKKIEKISYGKNKLIFVCHSGVRSHFAGQFISNILKKETYNFLPGMSGWLQKNLPVKKVVQL